MVGKGGVGKSTSAGALALALARHGKATWLLSTDPAHSLADLFATSLEPGRPTPSPCDPRLVLEELDAGGYARGWMARARRPVLELFERGTYLDRQDVEPFLELTLPGVDEVAGVLRLAELAEEDADHIVVDTAPTGHTLRLLDASAVVASWNEAFKAMADKAAAVLGQLTRRPVRLEGDDLVEDLEHRVRRFQEGVLPSATAVLVDRAGSVVGAETERLRRALEERGLPVGLRLRVGTAGDGERRPDRAESTPIVTVPYRTGLVGCDGIERWGAEGEEPQATAEASTGEASALSLLARAPGLVLFVGKGGVGKSTCAAAAALGLARERRVTLLSTDPAGSLEDVLGIPLAEGEARPSQSLTVRQVDAVTAFADLRSRYRRSVEDAFHSLGLDRSAALDRRVVESFLGLAPPGLDEVFAVVALLEDLAAGHTVVVDSAPTGHFLRLVAMPELALGWTHQLLRLLMKYRVVLGLDAFAERLLHFAKQLKDLNLTLRDPQRSTAFVVTQSGPLVAAETRRLVARLQEAKIAVGGVVWNRAPAGEVSLPLGGHPGPLLRAPLLEEAPVGKLALERFLSTWTVER